VLQEGPQPKMGIQMEFKWSWTVSQDKKNVTFAWFDSVHHIAKFQVIVDCSLGFSISVYGWFIPDDHPIYLQHKRSVRFTTAYSLLSNVIKYTGCIKKKLHRFEIALKFAKQLLVSSF
jgi:hypothetical protein